jgi:hypothetical protein
MSTGIFERDLCKLWGDGGDVFSGDFDKSRSSKSAGKLNMA